MAQQEVGAGQTTINKRAVKNTISHQWPTTGLCACRHGDGTTPLFQDYKTLFYTSPLIPSISPLRFFFSLPFLFFQSNVPLFLFGPSEQRFFFSPLPRTHRSNIYMFFCTWRAHGSCFPWSSSCLCPVGSSVPHDCQRGDSSTTGTFVQSPIRYWPPGIGEELWVIFFSLSHTVMSNITQLSFSSQLSLAHHHGNRRCNCTFLFVCLLVSF